MAYDKLTDKIEGKDADMIFRYCEQAQEDQTEEFLLDIQSIFKAFVDAIIPQTPELAEEYGEIQMYGAIDFQVDEFVILNLNEYDPALLMTSAQMLESAASQLIILGQNEEAYDDTARSSFAGLSQSDRLRALTILKQDNLSSLPYFNITDNLVKLTFMGYYSEWYGYGNTRLMTPDLRVLEFYPLSWSQIGYPGPNPGDRYREAQNERE